MLTTVRRIHSSAVAREAAVKISKPFTLGYTQLDSQYRMGYDPLYTSPSHKFVSLLKRTCLGFGFIGLYVSHLMLSTPTLFSESLIYLVTTCSVIPLPLAHLLTQHHVSRIWRLYDTTKPQTLENLTNDETLVAEKISFTGRKYYNTLIKVEDLELAKNSPIKASWKTDNELFYVKDDIGGIKMDRIWGLAEHHSGIDNGRYFGK